MNTVDVNKLLNLLYETATGNSLTSEDYVVAEVRSYWKQQGRNMDVVVYFSQKYDFENEWDRTSCVIEPDSNFEDPMEVHVVIDWDFCEGQQDVKDIHIVPLDEVIDFYAENKL